MAGRMSVRTTADRLRAVLREALPTMDDAAVTRLRGELHVVGALARKGRGGEPVAAAVRAALESTAALQSLGSEVRAFSASKSHANVASYFDLASVGILALENILTAERPSLFRLLMSGLSEASMFAASRQYVAGSNEVLVGIYRTHRVALYDDLWDLALELRGPPPSGAVADEVRSGIDGFLGKLDDPAVPVETKVAWLYQVRILVVLLRCVAVLDALSRSPRAASA